MKFVLELKGASLFSLHELTMTDITALQLDNQNRQEEVKYSDHGYREQLQADKILLIFCTVIPS